MGIRGKDKEQRTRRKLTSAEKTEKKRKRAAELRQIEVEKHRQSIVAKAAFFESRRCPSDVSSSANQDASSSKDAGTKNV